VEEPVLFVFDQFSSSECQYNKLAGDIRMACRRTRVAITVFNVGLHNQEINQTSKI